MKQMRRSFTASLVLVHFGFLPLTWSCGSSPQRTETKNVTTQSCEVKPKETNPTDNPAPASLNSAPDSMYPYEFALTGEIYYDSQIKSLLDENCVACHSGSQPPTLNTYQLAKLEIAKILDSVNGGRMPKSPYPPMPKEQVDLLTAWQASGMKQRAALPAGSPAEILDVPTPVGTAAPVESALPDLNKKIDTAKNMIACAEGVEVLDLAQFQSNPLLKRDQLSICQKEGFIFDRNEKVCSKAKLTTSYPCTRQGLVEAFKSTPTSVKTVLDEALGPENDPNDFGQFYSIDQCGQLETGEPIAYLVRLVLIAGETQLQVKELKVKNE